MADVLQIIADICDDLRANGFCHSPRIVKRDGFDLSSFKEQESDIEGLRTEFVDQRGPGMVGDDYNGTMAYPIGDVMFVIEYSS